MNMSMKTKINSKAKIAAAALLTVAILSILYYAPGIPPFLKPLMPLKYRWTNDEIVEQIKEKKVNKDFLAHFERDPERTVPREARIIVAPADGRVKVIRDVSDGNRIVIYMSVWDVHIQRVPLGGTVVDVVSSGHKDQEDFKCGDCPQNITRIDTEAGRITVKQVTSGLATKVQTYLTKGQGVEIGERLGYIFLGSHTVIDLPKAVGIQVKVGDRVVAGETIIAKY